MSRHCMMHLPLDSNNHNTTMKQLLLILALFACISAKSQTTVDTLALDSIAIDLPVKVGMLQFGWSIISDIDVRSAITSAVDTAKDTSQTRTVHLTGSELIKAYEPVAGMAQGLVRPWTDAIKPLIMPYLAVPENYLLYEAIMRIEASYDTQREYRRLDAIDKMERQLSSIKRNQ